jgi:hypothetical protein
MLSASTPPALYANGHTPLFLDTASMVFATTDGARQSMGTQVARIDYANRTAVVVFQERDLRAIEALPLEGRFHTTVLLTALHDPKHAEWTNPDLKISREMAATLPALDDGKKGGVVTALKERRLMLRAEEAIKAHGGYSYDETYAYVDHINPEGLSSSHFAALAAKARNTALTLLSRLGDGQALSVIEGNRLPDFGGTSYAIATIKDVCNRRAHLHAAAHMTRRLRLYRAHRPVSPNGEKEAARLHS